MQHRIRTRSLALPFAAGIAALLTACGGRPIASQPDPVGSGGGGSGSGNSSPDASVTAGASSGDNDAGNPPELCTTCDACEEELPVTSANHITGPIDYEDVPPAGGNHNPCWANWGVHAEVLPAENWVHNL